MTAPTPEDEGRQDTDQGEGPAVTPAYSTPPPEGLPDADSGTPDPGN